MRIDLPIREGEPAVWPDLAIGYCQIARQESTTSL